MKALLILLCSVALFLNVSLVSAQEATPTSIPLPRVQTQSNEFSVESQPSTVVTLLKNFIEGLDSFLGGFIFYTPDTLGNKITLKDGSEIPGVIKYRNIFHQIAIPAIAIIIAAIAFMRIGSDNAQHLKSFATRFIVTIGLFLIVPSLLSYSIQFNNLLVKNISQATSYTTFLNDYFDKSQQAMVNNNEPSEQYGIPSFGMSMQAGIFRSVGKFIVEVFLFAITFLFLLGGLLYIGFQFVIRFATLLFLTVIYPIVIPFALSERTEQIVHTYFRSWFTFLIQQPAFVLGFAIATEIFDSVLKAKGPSVGMLFFYAGFLFFLAGVNTLVARIFGDMWSAFSTNMQASIFTRTTGKTFHDTKQITRGFMTRSISTLASLKRQQDGQNNHGNQLGAANKKELNGHAYRSNGYATYKPNGNGSYGVISASPFSQELGGKGLQVQVENGKQGIISVSGEAYAHQNKKTGLTSIYPTRLDAIQDGIQENQLQKIQLKDEQFIDMSAFNKRTPNPHHLNAMEEARRQGKALNYGYLQPTSPPNRVKNFLELAKERNEALDVKGVIVKRQGTKSSDNIIRFYTNSKL